MAKYKRRTKAIKGQNKEQRKRCKDCAQSYDWHSKAIDGHLILCRCPHKQKGGKYCIFLSDYACELFIERTQQEKGDICNG